MRAIKQAILAVKAGLILALVTMLFTIAPGSVSDRASAYFQEGTVYYSGLRGTKTLALTFDDGPSSQTAKVLDILKQYGIKATFFLVGSRIGDHPDIMQRFHDEGHVIANHSKSHPQLGRKYVRNPEMLIKQIGDTHEASAAYFRPDQGFYFRAPYGLWRKAHAAVLNADPVLRNYVGPIYWDVGGQTYFDADGDIAASADWDCWRRDWSAEKCAKGYLREIRNKQGGVVLMHDVRSRTIAMVAEMVPELIDGGYRFITLDQVPAYDPLRTPRDVPVASLRDRTLAAAAR
jgi:peptidoglycan/xylan/chitin deacetylase (PgdA/CDA1 family)